MNEETKKALELARSLLWSAASNTYADRVQGVKAIDEALAAHAAPVARCLYCDDTGDVHTPTGEWRGRCTCAAGAAPAAPVATYVNERGDEVPERRSRVRDGDDPRIEHLFNGFDSRIESAQINFDKYAEGYLQAMRAEFAELIADMLAAAPAAPVAQPLTDEQASALWRKHLRVSETDGHSIHGGVELIRAVERTYGIGQGGAA